MGQVMQEMMGVIGSDLPFRGVAGGRIDPVDPRAMMVNRHYEGGWRTFGMSRCLRRRFRRPTSALQEMPQVRHIRGAEVLAVRLVHQETLPADVEAEPIAVRLVHYAYLLDQRHYIHPFEVMCRRVPEQGF